MANRVLTFQTTVLRKRLKWFAGMVAVPVPVVDPTPWLPLWYSPEELAALVGDVPAEDVARKPGWHPGMTAAVVSDKLPWRVFRRADDGVVEEPYRQSTAAWLGRQAGPQTHDSLPWRAIRRELAEAGAEFERRVPPIDTLIVGPVITADRLSWLRRPVRFDEPPGDFKRPATFVTLLVAKPTFEASVWWKATEFPPPEPVDVRRQFPWPWTSATYKPPFPPCPPPHHRPDEDCSTPTRPEVPCCTPRRAW